MLFGIEAFFVKPTATDWFNVKKAKYGRINLS
jgi:hypothetical protein